MNVIDITEIEFDEEDQKTALRVIFQTDQGLVELTFSAEMTMSVEQTLSDVRKRMALSQPRH